MERRRPTGRVVQHSGGVHGTVQSGQCVAASRVQDQSYAHGDGWRLWRQDIHLFGASCRPVVQEERTTGKAGHEPGRGVRGIRSRRRLVDQGEDGRHQRRQAHRLPGRTGPRRRRLSRFAGHVGRHVRFRLLRLPKRPAGRLRRCGEQTQNAGLPSSGISSGSLRCRVGSGRTLREARDRPS